MLGRAAAICLGADKYWVSLLPLSHLDSYAIGGLAAIAYHERRDRLPRYAIGCTLIGGALIVLSIFITAAVNEVPFGAAYALYGTSDGYLHHAFTGQIYLFLALFWTGVLFAMIAVNDRHPITAFRPIADMGRDSYHLYLFHWPIRTVCRYLFHNVWVVFLLTLALSLAANKCYKLLERAVKGRLTAVRSARQQ